MNFNLSNPFFKDSNKEIDDKFYQEFLTKQLILRDYLAIERTILTNEGTFLAYIRTSLTIAVVGVTILNLYPEDRSLQIIGIALAFAAISIFSVGLIRTLRMRKKINRFLKHREEAEADDNKTS